MKKQYALELFGGTVKALAEALHVTPCAVSQWGENLPPLRAYQVDELIRNGKAVPPKVSSSGVASA
ncbi:Cro/CI family transcriptional regulator [Deefgea piscis]|uniref:Cro/CI family transcriptional regulator n=1 Tax=Deefgea piscis TaxID=2739061 RepID=UPI001C7EE5E8|nr:Cro/CI family transcriptional regulator [Deefgea piscis]QZA80257.1 Cro/Cl family transcriptional regulator [Deefgea piscis]